NTDVAVQLTAADGAPVGDPVTVTTDEDGAFTTDLTVPEGTEGGDYTVVGTTAEDVSAQAPLVVTNAPSIVADPDRVPAGESTTVNGSDFPATTEVTVQLQDSTGAPVGDPVTVTTDEDGDFTTDLPVPAGTPEGEDYQVEATTADGDSATTPLAVVAEDEADNTANNTADNTEVNTSDNTADNTEVNAADNTADNTGDNTEVNSADNTADNTEVNEADNTAENTGDNTDVNTAENTEANEADNTAENTADNAAENTGDNTEVNSADNTADNTGDNTDENTADNTEANSADNTSDNTEVNAADNTADNTK